MKEPTPSFRTTRWSVVNAALADDSSATREALAVLCETYWYPLYSFLRRSGHAAHDAEDVTQGFFARLLDKRDFGGADPRRGRFRTYLLGALKHFLDNERDRARAIKRGGGQAMLSIDFADADRRFQIEAREPTSPDGAYERHWALALLGHAMERLRVEYVARGKQALFDTLRPALLGGDTPVPRDRLAAQLGMEEGALNTALHRLRKHFRAALRAEVADTVSDPADVEDELRFLRDVLAQAKR